MFYSIFPRVHCSVAACPPCNTSSLLLYVAMLLCRLMTVMDPKASWVAKWTHTSELAAVTAPTPDVWCIEAVSRNVCLHTGIVMLVNCTCLVAACFFCCRLLLLLTLCMRCVYSLCVCAAKAVPGCYALSLNESAPRALQVRLLDRLLRLDAYMQQQQFLGKRPAACRALPAAACGKGCLHTSAGRWTP